MQYWVVQFSWVCTSLLFLLFLVPMVTTALIHGGQIGSMVLFQFSCIVKTCFASMYVVILEKVPWTVDKKVYSFHLFGWNFCRCLLGHFDLWHLLTSEFLHLVFVWTAYLLAKLWYWSHPLSPCEDQCVVLAVMVFMNLGVLVFGAQMIRIVISSW